MHENDHDGNTLNREELKAEFAKHGLDFEAEEQRNHQERVWGFNFGLELPETVQIRSGGEWIRGTVNSPAFLNDEGPVVHVEFVGVVSLDIVRRSDPEADIREIERIVKGQPPTVFKA